MTIEDKDWIGEYWEARAVWEEQREYDPVAAEGSIQRMKIAVMNGVATGQMDAPYPIPEQSYAKTAYSPQEILEAEYAEAFADNPPGEDDEHAIMRDFFKRQGELMDQALFEIGQGVEQQEWDLVKAKRIKKIWRDYAKLGFVRDERGLEQIENQIIENMLKLEVNNILSGHHQMRPDEDTMEEYGVTQDMLNYTRYYEDLKVGQLRISDYGIDKLWPLAVKLRLAKTPEEKLGLIDQMLNVIHMRSDLPAWFIEGGTKTLIQLGDQ